MDYEVLRQIGEHIWEHGHIYSLVFAGALCVPTMYFTVKLASGLGKVRDGLVEMLQIIEKLPAPQRRLLERHFKQAT